MAGDTDRYDERVANALRGISDDQPTIDPPPADLWSRIEAEIASLDCADAPVDFGTESKSVPQTHSGAVVRLAPPQRPRSPRRIVALVAVIAMALVLTGAVAIGLARSSSPTQAELVASASLDGAGIEPGGYSTGTARLIHRGAEWEVDIDTTDLPPPAEGTYYEAWLLGGLPDQVQSLGTLDSKGDFLVPKGLQIADFPLVDVSIEPIDGIPAHSGQSILRGELTAG